MSYIPKIIGFAGSLRAQSYNKMLVRIALEGAKKAGAEITVLDLRDFPMPIYDGDLEQSSGIPDNGRKIKDLLKAHDGFLIASPEYNSSLSAALKNAIDWASRSLDGEKPLECFAGKVAGLLAASPGALGGLRGLVHLRAILGNINMVVVPEQLAVPKANEAFTASGSLADSAQHAKAEQIGARVAQIIRKLAE